MLTYDAMLTLVDRYARERVAEAVARLQGQLQEAREHEREQCSMAVTIARHLRDIMRDARSRE